MNKIYIEADKPAALQNGGELVNFVTLREAIEAWRRLPTPQRQNASITLLGKVGPVLQAADIERLQLVAPPRTIPLEDLNAENDE